MLGFYRKIRLLVVLVLLAGLHLAPAAWAEEGENPLAIVTSIVVSGADTIFIPVSGSTTVSYTAAVKDADGNEMPEETVAWWVQDPVGGGSVPGVTVDPDSGVVTVESAARTAAFTLQATSKSNGSVFQAKNVTLEFYISGRVFNFVTGSSVTGAKVQVRTVAGTLLKEVLTSADGSYTVTGLQIGTSYNVNVSRDGFRTRSVGPVQITDRQSLTQHVALTPQNVEAGNIEGYVVYAVTGANLQGVQVELEDGILGQTDYNGFYRISDLPVGKDYTLTTSVVNYVYRSVYGIKAGEGMDFALARNDNPVGKISGQVTNATSGAGVPGARVSAGFGLVAITDGQGNYVLDNLPAGTYHLQAYKNAYEAATVAVAVQSDTTAGQDFALTPNAGAGWITGYVWDIQDTSQRINGAQISIGGKTVLTQRPPGQSAYYYYQGYYFVSGLAPGNYELEVTAPGYHSRRTAAVTVGPGAGTSFNVALTKATVGVTLTGVVKSAMDGTPLSGAQVWVGDGTAVLTDSEGRYTITDLPAGSYSIRATRNGYRERLLNAVPVSGELEGAFQRNITLTPQNVEVGNIEGYAVNAVTGANLQGVQIELDDGILAYTDYNGWYRISDVPVGKNYGLTASFLNYISRSISSIKAGEGMDFALARVDDPVGGISGRVTNATSGEGIPGVRVSAGFGLVAITDGDGSYHLDKVVEGSYHLQAYRSGYEADTVAVAVVSDATAGEDFALTPNAGAGWITGYVWDIQDTSQRINSAQISIGGKTVLTQRPPGQSSYYYYQGYYFVTGLAPGNYELEVTVPGYHPRRTTAVTISPSAGTNFNVVLTKDTVGVTLTGVVKSGLDGTPLSGARVWVADGTAVLTDSEGNYTITHLPAGNYDIRATRNGYRERLLNAVPVGVDPGTLIQNIDLTPQNVEVGNVEGYVSSAGTGTNLSGVKVKLDDGLLVHTDYNGWYRISDVPVGKNYSLSASAANYLSRSVNGIRAGEGMDFAIAQVGDPVGKISGKVTNATSGAGLSGVRVSAGFGLVAVTDSEGAFNLDNLLEGTYHLQGYKKGFEAGTASVNVASGGSPVQDLNLLPYQGTGRVSGYVWYGSSTSNRLNGALVSIGGKTVQTQRPPGQSSYYSYQGSYAVEGLVPGTYQVKVSLPGYQAFTGQVTVPVMGNVSYNLKLEQRAVGGPFEVDAVTPASGALRVPVDTAVVIDFTELVQEVDPAGIRITADGTEVAVDYLIKEHRLILEPEKNLPYGKTLTVNIEAGAVNDTRGQDLAAGYSFTFRTVDARLPVVGFAPAVITAIKGENQDFIVDIMLSGLPEGQSVLGLKNLVTFDPAVLEVVGVEVPEDSFLQPFLSELVEYDNAAGEIEVNLARSEVAYPGPGGVIYRVTMRAKGSDTLTGLNHQEVLLRDGKGGPLDVVTKTATVTTYGLLGDFNNDGKIDFDDLMVFVLAWKHKTGDPGWAEADGEIPGSPFMRVDIGPMNGIYPSFTIHPDNKVEFDDLMVFAMMWNWVRGR